MIDILKRGVEEVIDKKHLTQALKSGKKLRVKLGIDPTATDLHLGHMVLLRKLRQFQDLGHQAVLIIGDFTALVGDPSGRDKTRPALTKQQIKANLKKYLQQAGKIINLKKTEIKYNSQWFKKIDLIIELAQIVSVQQVLHRADFKKRLEENSEITLLEALYPIFQGYDSVAVKADIELGGTDQKFNLLMGRQLQNHFQLSPQDVLMTPLIEGTDGVHKMSKSYGNFIALDEAPNEMFGKIMSLPDHLMEKYFETLTGVDPIPRSKIKKDPRGAKLLLAKTIVSDLYEQKTGEQAEADFIKTFSKKELPQNLPNLKLSLRTSASSAGGRLGIQLIDLLVVAGISSKSEARRLIEQGGVKIDDQIKKDSQEIISVKSGAVLRIGKHRIFKLVI